MDAYEQFFSAPAIAVVGASNDPDKYGHKCFAALLQHKFKAYPINPRATQVLGHSAYCDLQALPEKVQSLSIITPPKITEQVVDAAIALGVKTIWMQPGAESQAAIAKAQQAGIQVIAGGPCLLVELAKR